MWNGAVAMCTGFNFSHFSMHIAQFNNWNCQYYVILFLMNKTQDLSIAYI